MKKIFIILASIFIACSCEKMEMLFNSTCTIENSIPIEDIVSAEELANAISYDMQVVAYEFSANVVNENYILRKTSYPLNYGDSKKIILDNRAKYVVAVLSTRIVSVVEGKRTEAIVYCSTDFIPTEKKMNIVLDKTLKNGNHLKL